MQCVLFFNDYLQQDTSYKKDVPFKRSLCYCMRTITTEIDVILVFTKGHTWVFVIYHDAQ